MFPFKQTSFRFRKSWWLLGFFAMMFLSLTRHVAADPPSSSDTVATVTYTPTSEGLILLPLQLTGTQGQIINGTFLLDSGTNASILRSSLAGKLGLVPKPAIGSNGKPYTFQGKPCQMVEVAGYKIGAFSRAKSSFLVFDDAALDLTTTQHVDGVIGTDFLSTIPTLIDFAKHQVTFLGIHRLMEQDIEAAKMEKSVRMPLYPTSYSSYLCPVSLENRGHSAFAYLMVDTGAPYTTLSNQTAKQLSLRPVGKTEPLVATAGIVPTNFGGLDSIGFGDGMLVHNLFVAFYPDDKTNDILGVHLGLDFLGRYRLLLDFPGQRMYLQSYPPVTASLSPDSSKIPLLTLSLDGKTTGTFLVNTQADISSLNAPLAAKLDTIANPAVGFDGKPILVDGKPVQAVTLPQSNINGQPLTNAVFLMVDPATYVPLNLPVDGILGMNVLAGQACLLDMGNHKITIWGSNAFTPADLKEVDMADAVAVPLNQISGTNQFSVSAKLTNGKTSQNVDLALDTSQLGNYILGTMAAKLGLPAEGDPHLVPDNGTTYTIRHATVPEVSLGPLVQHDFHTLQSLGASPPGLSPHLGGTFFVQNRVLFDFAHKIMYVKPNPPAAPGAIIPTAPASAPTSGSH